MLLFRQCDKSGDNLNLSRQSSSFDPSRAKDASSKVAALAWTKTQIAVFF
jgi:hypothetical protein